MKRKHLWVNLIGLVFLLRQLLAPAVAMAADSSHYELKLWQFYVVGGMPSINFAYIGQDGVPLSGGFGLDKGLVSGHETDPSWTGLDSAAPILAYIKKYGIDNNIKEVMNPTCFDPTIFKALAAQGVNLSQLGGPDVPPGSNPPASLVGKSILPPALDKNVVGIGIPTPSISSTQQSTPASTSATTASSQATVQKSETVTNPTPPPAPDPPTSLKTTSTSSEPKTGTSLNTPPPAKESVVASVPDPQRLAPPAMAINDTNPTKIKEPVNNNPQDKTPIPWKDYLEIGGSFLALVAMFIYIKKNYVHS